MPITWIPGFLISHSEGIANKMSLGESSMLLLWPNGMTLPMALVRITPHSHTSNTEAPARFGRGGTYFHVSGPPCGSFR